MHRRFGHMLNKKKKMMCEITDSTAPCLHNYMPMDIREEGSSHIPWVQDQITLALYRKITFNTKKDLLDQGVLVNVLVVVLLFSSSVFLLLSCCLFFSKFIIMTFHWVSNTPPTHTHKAKLNKWRSALDIFSVWI